MVVIHEEDKIVNRCTAFDGYRIGPIGHRFFHYFRVFLTPAFFFDLVFSRCFPRCALHSFTERFYSLRASHIDDIYTKPPKRCRALSVEVPLG